MRHHFSGMTAWACLATTALSGCAPGTVSSGTCQVVKLADLPVTFYENTPIVEVRINGQAAHLMLDTGASVTVLNEATTQTLNMAPDPLKSLLISGVGTFSAHRNAIASRLEIGDDRIFDVSLGVVALPYDPKRLYGGFIGTDILERYDLELDEAHSRIGLYKPRNCPDGASGLPGTPVLLTRPPGGLSLPTTAIAVKVNGQPLSAIIDSGASGLAIDRATTLRLGVAANDLAAGPKISSDVVGKTKVQSTSHRFRSLGIGAVAFSNPTFHVVDLPNNGLYSRIDTLIGGSYLRHHRIWLSYGGHTAYVLD